MLPQYKVNTNLVINGTPVTSLTGDPVITQKTSDLGDGGLLQTADEIIIKRGTGNYKVNGGNILADASETLKGKIEIATQAETDAGIDDLKAITPLKFVEGLKNSSLATTTQKGVTQLVTPAEYFSKNNTKVITPSDVANDVRLARFSVGNSATGLTQAVAVGGDYNILIPLLSTNETQASNIPIVYKTTGNATQSKFLDNANDKFLFPSNLNTFNLAYVPYLIRVIFTVNIPTISNDRSTEFTIAIRRVIDNSEVASTTFFKATGPAVTNKQYTAILKTFVNSETDPYVIDGCSVFIENNSGSETQITLTSVNIRIFRD